MSHHEVDDAAVVPIEHPVKGHVPVAMVMCPGASGVDESSLKQYCLDHGPAYAHPRRILVVDQLPLNGAGKVDRSAITRRLQEDLGRETAETGGIA